MYLLREKTALLLALRKSLLQQWLASTSVAVWSRPLLGVVKKSHKKLLRKEVALIGHPFVQDYASVPMMY